jgi:hypothetical protein
LLGTKPDADVGRIIGRPGKAVWAKRHALGVPDPPSLVRLWTEDEDKVVLSQSVAEAAKALNRTNEAVKIRRAKLLRKLGPDKPPKLLTLEEAKLRIEVPKYDSKEQEEQFRLVDGPYAPPLIAIGGWLKCELRGELPVGGFTNALIPWPVAVGHAKQRIVCGDLVRALKTEVACSGVLSFWDFALGGFRISAPAGHRAADPGKHAVVSAHHRPGANLGGTGQDFPAS